MGSARLLGFSAHEGQRFLFPTRWRLLARSTSQSGFPASVRLFCFSSLERDAPVGWNCGGLTSAVGDIWFGGFVAFGVLKLALSSWLRYRCATRLQKGRGWLRSHPLRPHLPLHCPYRLPV